MCEHVHMQTIKLTPLQLHGIPLNRHRCSITTHPESFLVCTLACIVHSRLDSITPAWTPMNRTQSTELTTSTMSPTTGRHNLRHLVATMLPRERISKTHRCLLDSPSHTRDLFLQANRFSLKKKKASRPQELGAQLVTF